MSILSDIISLSPDLPPLSDHTPAIYSFQQVNKSSCKMHPLTILTWNKLNKGHSTANCFHQINPYSNNPFNKDENIEQYASRINKGYNFLIHEIKKNEISVILLQEVNDLIFQNPCINTIKKRFFKKLKKLNWEYLITTKDLNTKPLAILFHSTRLEFKNEKRGVLASNTGKNHAFEATFYDLINRINMCITTCHLDYAYDFRKNILSYQEDQRKKNIFTVIIGDTNRCPDIFFPSFFGNCRYPSSIKIDGSYYELKKLDCAAASPQREFKVIIREQKNWYFEYQNNTFFLKYVENDPIEVESLFELPYVNDECLKKHIEILEDPKIMILQLLNKNLNFELEIDGVFIHLTFKKSNNLKFFIRFLKNNLHYEKTNLSLKFNLKEFIEFFNIPYSFRIEVLLRARPNLSIDNK